MTIHIVTVTAPGGVRYFDSVWVRSENAATREKQLRDEFKRSGFELNDPVYMYSPSQWATRTVTAEACDGSIADSQPADASIAVSDLPGGRTVTQRESSRKVQSMIGASGLTPQQFADAYCSLTLEQIAMARSLSSPEPAPTPNTMPAVWDLVIADMCQRDQSGEKTYGTRLQPFNGRDALVDAYQEALDLAAYLRQAIYERDSR